MTIIRSLLLFVAAALAEIGGAWLVWQGVREHRGPVWMSAGVAALGLYGFVATLQSDAHFGRILAAYGGIFVAGSLVWGVVVDKFRPDRYDIAGSVVCLVGVAVNGQRPGRDTAPKGHSAWNTRPIDASSGTEKRWPPRTSGWVGLSRVTWGGSMALRGGADWSWR
jgi:small multidrug resistance family-3 protein